MATLGESPTLFLRKATGLVKGWSKFDAFVYSFMSVNFVTLGLFFSLAVTAYVPSGHVLPALLISLLFITFIMITVTCSISSIYPPGADAVLTILKFAGGAAALPKSIGLTPFFGDSLLIIPFLCFWILWPNWGATLYGEVRGASDFKRVMSGMMYGLWVTIAIAVVFLLLASKFFGW